MRKIYLEYPDGTKISATIVEGEEPVLADMLWEAAGRGEKYLIHQPISAGFAYKGIPKPRGEKVPVTKPKFSHQLCLTEQCALYYDGFWIRFNYGPQTETLLQPIGLVARIDPEDIEAFKEISNTITNNRITYNNSVTAIKVTRRED